jgi:hypothetical protein
MSAERFAALTESTMLRVRIAGMRRTVGWEPPLQVDWTISGILLGAAGAIPVEISRTDGLTPQIAALTGHPEDDLEDQFAGQLWLQRGYSESPGGRVPVASIGVALMPAIFRMVVRALTLNPSDSHTPRELRLFVDDSWLRWRDRYESFVASATSDGEVFDEFGNPISQSPAKSVPYEWHTLVARANIRTEWAFPIERGIG